MTEAQRKQFEKALPIERRISHQQQTIIATLHSEIFKHKFHMPSPGCGKCKVTWYRWVEDLKNLYDQ